jgi:hypothetical protein
MGLDSGSPNPSGRDQFQVFSQARIGRKQPISGLLKAIPVSISALEENGFQVNGTEVHLQRLRRLIGQAEKLLLSENGTFDILTCINQIHWKTY